MNDFTNVNILIDSHNREYAIRHGGEPLGYRSTMAWLFTGSILFLIMILPSLATLLDDNIRSFSPGTLVSSLLIICLALIFSRRLFAAGISSSPRLLFGIALTILIHGLVCEYFYFQDFDTDRFYKSLLLLVLVLAAAQALAKFLAVLSARNIDMGVKLAFWLLTIVGIMGAMGISPFWKLEKGAVFFTEPSHFSIAYAPFMLYMMVISDPALRVLTALTAVVLGFFFPNATIVICAGYFLFITNKLRYSAILAGVVGTLIVIYGTIVDLDYFSDRFDVMQSENMSAMVYRSGWERAFETLLDSVGLGGGFQQFGIVTSFGQTLNDIFDRAGGDLNLLDGSTVGSKFIGEFGILGVGGLAVYAFVSARLVQALNRISRRSGKDVDLRRVFAHVCFVSYGIDLFVRGAGYFSTPALLFLASVFFLWGRENTAQSINQ